MEQVELKGMNMPNGVVLSKNVLSAIQAIEDLAFSIQDNYMKTGKVWSDEIDLLSLYVSKLKRLK